MRILMVTGTFPPRKFGGITKVSYQLALKLAELGHDITVYTTDVGNDVSTRLKVSSNEKINKINVKRFRNLNNYLAFVHRLYLPLDLPMEMSKNIKKFDVIHIHDFRSPMSVFVHYIANKYRVPYVLQPHGSLPRLGKQNLKRIYDLTWGYRILRDAYALIALTKTEAEQFKMMGVDENKIKIIPNGIDLKEFENLPEKGSFIKKYGLDDDQRIILYLARVHKIKGPDLLVKAFSDVSKMLDKVKLVVVGPDDGYLGEIQQLAKKLKIYENVVYTGPIFGREKLGAYVDADVYILPSVYETFPVSVLEACACGTPVIVTDRCGIADFIDGQAGTVVPYDKNAMGEAIVRLLNDDSKRQWFGQGGRTLVQEKFSLDKVAEQIEEVYEKCIQPTR